MYNLYITNAIKASTSNITITMKKLKTTKGTEIFLPDPSASIVIENITAVITMAIIYFTPRKLAKLYSGNTLNFSYSLHLRTVCLADETAYQLLHHDFSFSHGWMSETFPWAFTLALTEISAPTLALSAGPRPSVET